MPSGDPLPSFYYPPVDKRLLQIGFYLTTIGSHHYSLEKTYPIEGHPEEYCFTWEKGRILHDFALVLNERGNGFFESTSVPLTPVKAGQAIWLVPGEWHRYQPDSAEGWTQSWIGLNGFHLHQLRKQTILPERSALFPKRSSSHFESTVSMQKRLLKDVSTSPSTNRSSWSTRALEILLQFFEKTPAAEDPESTPTDDPLVNLALCYIRENCHRPLTVNAVAARCQAGRRSLERHFAKVRGQSVAKEILCSRIERAEFLLKESHLPIKEIAHSCGFATPQRMIYSFRQHFGCTPGSVR